MGKRVYARLDTRILEMESTEQRDERVARGSSNGFLWFTRAWSPEGES